MAGGNSSKKNNYKENHTFKASSTSALSTSGNKAPTTSKGKQPANNDVSPLSKARPQGRPPLPPPPPSSSSTQYSKQDHLMPIANVIRVMRRILPSHAKISEDAKDTVNESVSEFISFVTQEANEKCCRELRKTITADDLISAMSTLGFDNYVDPLSTYLHNYRQSEAMEHGRVTQMPMRRHTVASPAMMVRPSIVVGPNPIMTTDVSTATAIPTATNTAVAAKTVTTTGSYIGDHEFGLINNACYDQIDVGGSSSNDVKLLQFGDDFDQLSPMVAPRSNASNAGVYQDQGEIYDPFAQFK